jgi:DNA-binding NtrC family response regulator
VRLIAASNRDLTRAVAEGVLREDLFYRLNVIPIELPALRDRRDDISLLVDHFLQRFARETGKDVRSISPEALARLEVHRWPGNIRELQNVIERAIVLGRGSVLDVDALPIELLQPVPDSGLAPELPPEGLDLEATLEAIEQRLLRAALDRTGGVQTRAAELLKMSFRQFRYKLQKLGPTDQPRAR